MKRWLVAGLIAGAVLGTVGVARAQSEPTPTVPSASGQAGQPANRAEETPLTGDLAARVTAAAQAAVPDATVDRVENDADGAKYEAHMTKSDGSHVTVTFDENLNVVEIQTGGPGGPGEKRGHGGPGGRGGETELTGTAASSATAAAQAAVPGGTVNRVETEGDGTAAYEAHVTKPDGTRVEVKLDANFNVVSVQDEPARPAGPGGPKGGRHGEMTSTPSSVPGS